jgi:hypothetical protein
MPKYFTTFREAVPTEASKTDETWKKQILMILEKRGIPAQDIAIRITGNYKSSAERSAEF